MDKKVISYNLNILCEYYTEKEISEAIGCSVSAISRWKTGDRTPKLRHIKFLCDKYNLDIEDFCNKKLNVKLQFE